MKRKIKNIILKFISKEQITQIVTKVKFFNNYLFFFQNYYEDAKLYYKHSAIYKINTFQKFETKVILRYHSIEKGLIQKNLKPRFAINKVKELHTILSKMLVLENNSNSQIQVAIKILIKYYDLHKSLNINIDDYFSEIQYESYKKRIILNEANFNGYIEYQKVDFYKNLQSNFEMFSNSRKSVRNFTGEKLSDDLIKQAISLSLNSPSVCNRQASRVYLIEDEFKIQEILKIQGGFSGFSQNLKQLLIVTSNRSYFYSLGERNQFYIDGGIFLMNLLYCLHYFRIANCPANWGKKIDDEKRLAKIITFPENEKIICLIPIGVAETEFKVPLSQRRHINEIFYKI